MKELGGYAFTHVARIERVDGSQFGFADVETERALQGLWHLLSFAAGALIGVVLPVGFDQQGKATGVFHRVMVSDYFRHRLSWLDPLHIQDVGILFARWFQMQDDPFWSSTINRVIRRCLTANAANPINQSIITALSGLEILAWVVLEVESGWLDFPCDGALS